MEALCSSETLVSAKSIRCYNPEDEHGHLRRHDRLKSHATCKSFFTRFVRVQVVSDVSLLHVGLHHFESHCTFLLPQRVQSHEDWLSVGGGSRSSLQYHIAERFRQLENRSQPLTNACYSCLDFPLPTYVGEVVASERRSCFVMQLAHKTVWCMVFRSVYLLAYFSVLLLPVL
jgi:hypothetical protein